MIAVMMRWSTENVNRLDLLRFEGQVIGLVAPICGHANETRYDRMIHLGFAGGRCPTLSPHNREPGDAV
jgi:hypothetical protein